MKINEEIDDMIKDYIKDCWIDDPDPRVSTTSNIYIDMSNVSTTTMNSENDYSDLISDDVIDLSGLSGMLSSPINNTISIQGTAANIESSNISFDIYDTEKRLRAIEKRLAILEPRKDLLDKYEVLQSLYEQYKAAEAMLYEDEEEEEFPF